MELKRLSYTSHNARGRAQILMDGTLPTAKQVGRSQRTPFPLGGYMYEIRDMDGNTRYSGSAMSEGLKALALHLDDNGEIVEPAQGYRAAYDDPLTAA